MDSSSIFQDDMIPRRWDLLVFGVKVYVWGMMVLGGVLLLSGLAFPFVYMPKDTYSFDDWYVFSGTWMMVVMGGLFLLSGIGMKREWENGVMVSLIAGWCLGLVWMMGLVNGFLGPVVVLVGLVVMGPYWWGVYRVREQWRLGVRGRKRNN